MLNEPYPRASFPFTSCFPAVVTWLRIPHPNDILRIRASVVLDVVHNERQFNESDVPESTAPPVSPCLPSTSLPQCPFTTASLVYWLSPAHLATQNWLGWCKSTPPLLWTLSPVETTSVACWLTPAGLVGQNFAGLGNVYARD